MIRHMRTRLKKQGMLGVNRMADKGSSFRSAEEGEKAPKRAKMEDQGQETHPKQVQVGQQSVGEGGQGPAQGSTSVQGPGFVSAPADPQAIQPPGQGYFGQQQAALVPHQGQGQQAYGGYPAQGFPMAPQQAGHMYHHLPPAGQPAANIGQPPALQMSVGAFGGATVRIESPAAAGGLVAGGLVAGAFATAAFAASKVAESPAVVLGTGLAAGVATGVTTLAGFYLGNRQQTEEAIRRVVERERHIQVENIEEGSILVHVKFITMAGYWIMRSFNERIDKQSDRTCLQLLLEDELQRIGWTSPVQVGMEGWWFADKERQEEEEAAGTEQEEERWEWAGMMEKQSVPPSVTTEADSGLSEDVSSVAAMSITSAEEVEEGPLKWARARLQKHKDAQGHIKAFRSWEEGAEILTSSGYTDLGGVKALVQGFMLDNMAPPDYTSRVLYGQSWLNLNKAQLKQLMTSQLQADPTDSTCLLLTALQLPHRDSRVQTLQQVVAAILQHGPGDWLYQHLHHIYCYLGWAIWVASPQPKPTMASQGPTVDLPALSKGLSAMASSLMYKQDHLETVYLTARLSMEVSDTEAIRQFEHFLRLALECDFYVPYAHYRLATLYNQQQDRQKVIHHFTRGQQTEAIRLPVFNEVPKFIKDSATTAYEQAFGKKQASWPWKDVLFTGQAAGIIAAAGLAAFYLGNRQQTDKAIRRAVEREGHIRVETQRIEEG